MSLASGLLARRPLLAPHNFASDLVQPISESRLASRCSCSIRTFPSSPVLKFSQNWTGLTRGLPSDVSSDIFCHWGGVDVSRGWNVLCRDSPRSQLTWNKEDITDEEEVDEGNDEGEEDESEEEDEVEEEEADEEEDEDEESESEREEEEESGELIPLVPAFYRMGYVRLVRAYGVEFLEGPNGVGVYAAKDLPFTKKPVVVMEIPVELMITISKEGPPWIMEPDFIPMGHALYDAVCNTDPKTEWDLRLALLLLLALDDETHFWRLYGDFLPAPDETPSLLLATDAELAELQDPLLAEQMQQERQRALEAWTRFFPPDARWRMRRICPTSERFLWALAQVTSRSQVVHAILNLSLRHDIYCLVPYLDMVNHSEDANCSFRWRKRDNIIELILHSPHPVRAGDQLTISYLPKAPNQTLMRIYGFSSPHNPWEVFEFTSSAKIHRDSFLSTFNVSTYSGEYQPNLLDDNEQMQAGASPGVNGSILAAARTLPLWWDGDKPGLPSLETAAARELQDDCRRQLAMFPTSAEEDQDLLDTCGEDKTVRWKGAIRYRLHRKQTLLEIIKLLDMYVESLYY